MQSRINEGAGQPKEGSWVPGDQRSMLMLEQERVSQQVKLVRHNQVPNRVYCVGEGSIDLECHHHKIPGRPFAAERRI